MDAEKISFDIVEGVRVKGLDANNAERFALLDVITKDAEGNRVRRELSFDDARRLVACWNACDGIRTEALEALPRPFGDLLSDKHAVAVEQIEWLEQMNTLHRQVDILYVVDGYEVTVTWDDNAISDSFHGATVAEAISKAMAGFDPEARNKYRDQDIYGHERQMAALTTQRGALLADLTEAAATLRRYETLLRAKGTDESTAKAEVNAELATRFEATIAKVQGGAA